MNKVRFNTLLTKLKLKSPQDIKNYLVGKYMVPRVNTHGHNYMIGQKYRITDDVVVAQGYLSNVQMEGGYAGYTIYFTEFELGEEDLTSLNGDLKMYNKMIKDLEKTIELTKEKISYLEENKLTSIEEPDFKLYVMKKVLSSKATDDEKAAKIAALMF